MLHDFTTAAICSQSVQHQSRSQDHLTMPSLTKKALIIKIWEMGEEPPSSWRKNPARSSLLRTEGRVQERESRAQESHGGDEQSSQEEDQPPVLHHREAGSSNYWERDNREPCGHRNQEDSGEDSSKRGRSDGLRTILQHDLCRSDPTGSRIYQMVPDHRSGREHLLAEAKVCRMGESQGQESLAHGVPAEEEPRFSEFQRLQQGRNRARILQQHGALLHPSPHGGELRRGCGREGCSARESDSRSPAPTVAVTEDKRQEGQRLSKVSDHRPEDQCDPNEIKTWPEPALDTDRS